MFRSLVTKAVRGQAGLMFGRHTVMGVAGLSSCLRNQIRYDFCTKGTDRPQVDAKFKEESKQFYNNFVDNIIEITSTQEWQNIIPNTKEPIIVDLYADWCGPCKKLTPRLEERVKEMEGVKMVKINIDKCAEIATALKVKSVPTVYLVFQGQAVDGFQGNVDDAELNKFFKTIAKLIGTDPEEIEAIKALQVAKNFMNEQKMEEAIEVLLSLKSMKIKQDLVALKELFLAQCYLSSNKAAKFKDSFIRLTQHEEFFNQVPDLLRFYNIMKEEVRKLQQQSSEDQEILELKRKVEQIEATAQNKDELLSAKYELAELYKKKQLMDECLGTAIEIVKEDKNWQEKKANKFILAVFKELGNASPLVQKHRKVFQRLLN